MKRLLAIGYILLFSSILMAGEGKLTRQSYIDLWKDEAIYQMVEHGIPASITLAQGILESGDGNSDLARISNNHFGIKCHSDWSGGKVYHDDDRKGECFRVYETAHQSFEDHSAFLLRNRYSSLFDLKTTDYKGWAKGLRKCGYATNPQYSKLLIRLVEENKLHEFDKEGVRMIKKGIVPERDIPEVSKDKKKDKKKKGRKDDRPEQIDIDTEDDDVLVTIASARTHSVKMSTNQIKYCIAKTGDTFDSIADDMHLMRWQLPKYNDLPRNGQLEEGQIIYLQPKRKKALTDTHVMSNGETLWSVSQAHGVRMKNLLKLNNLDSGSSPPSGTTLQLR